MAEIQVSDDEIRAHIRKRGPVGVADWGPRRTLDWEVAKRELIALKAKSAERKEIK